MDEVEAVARAIEDQLTAEDGWMVGTPAIKRMCEDFAQAAIAALDAARGNAEPVAASRKWANALANIRQGRRSEPLCEPPSEYAIENALEWLKDALLASPTPLYAHPPAPDAARGDPVARVVEWLRAMKRDDTNWPQHIAFLIERGEPFNG